MEVWWSVSIKQSHSAIRHLFISVHHAVVFIITVCVLQHHKKRLLPDEFVYKLYSMLYY